MGVDSSESVVGRTAYDIYPKDLAEQLIKNQKRVIATNQPLHTQETIMNVTTGKLQHYEVTLAPLHDDTGKTIGVYGVSLDISAHKEAEAMKLENEIFNRLEEIAQFIPVPFYWMDLNQVVLGGNKLLLETVGVDSPEQFIGQTEYDIYPKDIAEQLIKNQKRVIATNQPLHTQETITNITTGKLQYYEVTLAPLHDGTSKIIGVYGVSLDISAHKEAEAIKLQNEKLIIENKANQTIHAAQAEFHKITRQVVHDIRSPLAALNMATKMPQPDTTLLKQISTRIDEIAHNLLSQYPEEKSDQALAHNLPKNDAADKSPLPVSIALSEIITEKKYQFKGQPVQFDMYYTQAGYFAFAEIDIKAFKRMVSNLLNNAVEALEGKSGIVKVNLDVEANQFIKITIVDTGKGMPEHVIEKIKSNVVITYEKTDGHGIGMSQIHDTLEVNHGTMDIHSEIGMGTQITIRFPKTETPDYITDQLTLRADDHVIILDDEVAIHTAWEKHLKAVYPDIHIQNYYSGEACIQAINSASATERAQLVLIADYELNQQPVNGQDVIEQTQLERNILCTSYYADINIQKRAQTLGIKILPKPFASEVPIDILSAAASTIHPLSETDGVIVDDDPLFTQTLQQTLSILGKKVDIYHSSNTFLKQVQQYHKHHPILLDLHIEGEQDGLELAQQLYYQGYEKLYLISGKDLTTDQIPNYVVNINKMQLLDHINTLF